ncbi:MAG TPA: PAS domain S-box protein [Candidatus Acidoferrum sp.]|nr:PAS domain S-box protein [Candidatus Acidoferrum sp.]
MTGALWFGSRTLFSADFLPHSYCYIGNQRLLWSNVVADALIGLSYLAILAALVKLVHRASPDLPDPHFFWVFGVFIVSCGATHFVEILTVWRPVYWVLVAVKAITSAASVGTAFFLILKTSDILDFVRTARQAAARRGSEQFRLVINASPMAVLSVDLQGRITAWNPAAESLFGLNEQESAGTIASLAPPEKREEQAALMRKTLAGQVTTGFETVRIDRKGRGFPASISVAPLLDDQGSITGAVAFIEDISERRQIADELQEKTEILGTVTQVLNSYLEASDWGTASRHLLTFAIHKTQSVYGFLGVVLEQGILRVLTYDGVVLDVNLNRAMHEEKISQHAAEGYFAVELSENLVAEVIKRGETVISNSPGSDPRSRGLPAGHPELTAVLGVPIFKGREVVGLIAVANRSGGYSERDIHSLQAMSQATGVLYDSYRQSQKRKALEKDQRSLEYQVRQAQKMEVLGRLAGGVAHDFNNMLMVLGGCTELLDRSLPGDSPSRLYLHQIQRTIDKAAAVTRQLLTFSRKQVLELHPMDLREALTDSEFLLPRLLGPDVHLTFHQEAKRSRIISNPAQIGQVIANLAINASDAMPHGGRLTISTRNATSLPGDGFGSEAITGDWVVLEVSDTGSGMDEKTRAQIFEPFFTTKPPGKGTGLGLATVYGIAKQSHGHIRVETALGVGTRFELYFPLAEVVSPMPPASPSSGAAESQFVEGRGATILVADDEASLRQAVVQILSSAGYQVLEADTAQHAVEISNKLPGKLDLLLTDVVMPGLRGPELARLVANRHPQVRIVFMSGYAEGFPETQLPPHSVFLQKPFRFATLLEQLKLVQRKE